MAVQPEYQPSEADFERVSFEGETEAIYRPSLSYWQDAWIRLKTNTRTMISLGIVMLLFMFTVFGPLVWRIDPAQQDLQQISKPPSWGQQATLAENLEIWKPSLADIDEDDVEELDLEEIVATQTIEVIRANTQSVRLRWQAVEGAFGYAIYRNEHRPENNQDLGLPLGESDSPARLFYEDRLKLESRRYYYSVVATDGVDESEAFNTLAVEVTQAITFREASVRNLDVSGKKIGDRVQLEWHPFGTDYLGRDMLARLMSGARVSLFIGVVAPVLYILLGIVYGGISGYMGGRVDNLMMRFSDFVVALPFLLFMILFKIAFGIGPGESGIFPMLVALVILGWPGMARLVRGQVLLLREEVYIDAAKLLGAGRNYIIARHIMPNVMGVILVTLTFAIPSAIFTEAFLSFIGMGVAPPTPSWGSMCNDGIKTILNHPHELIFPALLISITVLALNLLGDGLRDALDSKLRSRD